MSTIKETTLHPDGNEGVDLYPKTNINQVQELPQKLTSVETQINQLNNGKLTKPLNPSAESAVTMLADGTVGTKLLSEIGGSGKLYRHDIKISLVSGNNYFYTSVYLPYNTSLVTKYGNFSNIGSVAEYNKIFPTIYYCTSVDTSISSSFGQGVLTFRLLSNGETDWNTYSIIIAGCTLKENVCSTVDLPNEPFVYEFAEDIVTEI